jgi:hypothetical protein
VSLRLPGLRYTKRALLLFGLGLILGLVVVAGQFAPFERVASTLMALGLVLLMPAVIADTKGAALFAWIAARLRRGRGRQRRGKSRPGGRRKPAPRPSARTARRKRG